MQEEKGKSAHVLVLLSLCRGHINPMLHFADRLAINGLRATLVVPIQNRGDIGKADPRAVAAACLEYISDGYDDGLPSNFDVEIYRTTFQCVGSKKLLELIARLTVEGPRPVCLIYDSFLSWALELAHAHGLLGATFITQPLAVCLMYCYYGCGLQINPDMCVFLPRMPPLGLRDLPSFIAQPESNPLILEMMLGQFKNMGKADFVLVNSFDKLEEEARKEMVEPWSLKMIRPVLPLAYLNDERPDSSVVYVSFGSLATLPAEQMEEIANALLSSNRPFLWVVKAPYAHQKGGNSLPEGFVEATSEQGLVVPWCPQLHVLAHRGVGCFVTHCGWNSTLEGLSQGVPMVTVPQRSYHPTNAKFVSDVWITGARLEVGNKGFVLKGELERCIREVMEGERGAHIRANAQRWRDQAREAVAEGGPSDNNVKEFVTKVPFLHLDREK
ncbi:hypothetical protein AMTRI_Chr05g68360 [Amborella trichopoda]